MIISGTQRPFFGRSAQSQVNDILSSLNDLVEVQRRMSSKADIEQEMTNLIQSA